MSVRLSSAEVTMIAGALLETLEAVDDLEFFTRLRREESDFRALRTDSSVVIKNGPPEA